MSGSLRAIIVTTKSSITSLVETGLVSKKRREIKASASETLVSIAASLDALPSHQYRNLKATLKVLANTCEGIVNGIDQDELQLKDIRPIVRDIKTRIYPAVEDSSEKLLVKAASEPEETTELSTDVEGEEGLSSGQRKELKRMLAESNSLQEALQVIKPHLDITLDRKAREKAIQDAVDNPGEDDDDTNDEPALEDIAHLGADDKHLSKLIAEVKAKRRSLPQTFKGPFTIIRSPVVPIFNDPKKNFFYGGRGQYSVPGNFQISPEFHRLGIPCLRIGDYIILTEQLLLAVKVDVLNEFKVTKEAELNSVQRAQLREERAQHKKKHDGDMENFTPSVKRGKVKVDSLDMARAILEEINEHSHNKYQLVSSYEVANPRNTKILLLWIMPYRIISKLQQIGWSKVKSWGLPY